MDEITFEYLYTVEGYITFIVTVKAGAFSGASGFCIAESWLKNAIFFLSDMYRTLNGSYQMDDYDSDDFMCFEMETLGHMKVTGQVGGSHNTKFLNYECRADQTMLAEIIASFKHMIAAPISSAEHVARIQSTQ